MGCAGVRRHICHVHDVDVSHVVQVCAASFTRPYQSYASRSARLPGSTVALFSTLQPLFTGMLGLVGNSFSCITRYLMNRNTVLNE